MQKLLLVLTVLLSTQLFAQDTWHEVVEPDVSIKKFRVYTDGTGWVSEDGGDSFKVTEDGGLTWQYKATAGSSRPNVYSIVMDIDGPSLDQLFAFYMDNFNSPARLFVKKFNLANGTWEDYSEISFVGYDPLTVNIYGLEVRVNADGVISGFVPGENSVSQEDHSISFLISPSNPSNWVDIRQNLGLTSDYTIVDMAFYGENNGMMIFRTSNGPARKLYSTTDGGATWSDIGDLNGEDLDFDLQALNATTFLYNKGNDIHITTDGGQNWNTMQPVPHPDMNPNPGIDGFNFYDENCGLVIRGVGNTNSYIYKTTDGGNNWTRDSISADVPFYFLGEDIFFPQYTSCDTWFAITSDHVISNRALPFGNTSSVSEFGYDGGIDTYPNPTNGVLQVTSLKPIENASVHFASGQLVRTLNLKTTNQIDMSDLASGVYFLHVETEAGMFVKKVVRW